MLSETFSIAVEDPQYPTVTIPACDPSRETLTLLAVSPDGSDSQYLRSVFGGRNWNIQRASSVREATRLLNVSRPNLILCEKDLPDGCWKDLVRETGGKQYPSPVVVVSRNADERTWAEVLNMGGYDMLQKPFDDMEVLRVVTMASRQGRLSPHSVGAVA